MTSLLEVSRELKAMAETGLRYSEADSFDHERYERLHQLASEVLQATHTDFHWPVELGYATPKIDVRAAVFRDDKILLVQEKSNGLWTPPGGWADVNSTPAANVAREVREEAGLEVTPTCLVACQDRDAQGHNPIPEHVYLLLFLCEDLGGNPTAGSETSDAQFFALDDLPDLCPSRTAEKHLHLAASYRAKPNQPARFD